VAFSLCRDARGNPPSPWLSYREKTGRQKQGGAPPIIGRQRTEEGGPYPDRKKTKEPKLPRHLLWSTVAVATGDWDMEARPAAS